MDIKEKLRFLIKLSQLFNKKEKQQFFFIMVIVLIMSLFQALGVASVFPFISLVMNPGIIFQSRKLLWLYNFLNCSNERHFIIVVGVLVAGLIIVGNLISALTVVFRSKFIWRKSHHLATAVLRQYLFAPYLFFLTQHSADLGKNILMEVQILTISFMIPLLEIVTNIMLITMIFSTLIIVSPVPSIISLLIFCGFYGFIYQFGLRRDLKAKGGRRLIENTARFKAVSEAFGGIKDIKILGRETFFLDRFKGHSLTLTNLISWHEITNQIPRYFIEIIAFVGSIVFVLFFIISGKDIKQIIPAASFFVFAAYRLMPIVNRMFQAFTKMQFNQTVLDKIHEDLHGNKLEKTCAVAGPDETPAVFFEKEIIFDNISFSYPATDRYVFKRLAVTISKNTSVAIVGPTGCGKTTLVDILLGLLSPTEGEIRVDGICIDKNNVRAWQGKIGYVPQFIYLADDTIKRNIAFGLTDDLIEDKKVEMAARVAHLHDFVIDTLPEGYNTFIGERGVRLSGGQRQRVGIARALYNNPDVLVFDEATSSLDGVTENVVLAAIEEISKLKTMIVIAHRLTTVRKCDMIYVIDKGQIAAQGTYEKLMRENPQFQAMAQGDTRKNHH